MFYELSFHVLQVELKLVDSLSDELDLADYLTLAFLVVGGLGFHGGLLGII